MRRRPSTLDRDALREYLRKLGRSDHLAMLDAAIDRLSDRDLAKVVKGRIDLGRMQRDPEKPVRGLLETVRAFHAASLAGERYKSFRVNSRNSSQLAEGTEDWIADCEQLFDRCVAAGTGAGGLPREEVREALRLLIDLMGRLDQGEEIVFFADEGASYVVGVDWGKVLPCYFRCLAPSVDAKAYAEEVLRLLEAFASSRRGPLLAKARAAGTPGQLRALGVADGQ